MSHLGAPSENWGLFLSMNLRAPVLSPLGHRCTPLFLGEIFLQNPQEARPMSPPITTPGSGLKSFITFNLSCLT